MPACQVCNADKWFLKSCPKCSAKLCGDCLNYALIEENLAATPCCRQCFRAGVQLDLTTNVETYGPPKGEAVSVLLLHGGGGCRAMYRHLAQHLAKHGFRCVLPDLPAHGGRMDEPVSIDACVEAIRHAVETEAAPFCGVNPIYLGGSFGGYTGMEYLARYPHTISGAILACCAQNTGVGAGLPARLGLSAMIFMQRHVLNAAFVAGSMMSIAAKHKHLNLEEIKENSARCGWYFHQGVAITELLTKPDILALMAKYDGPVLYLNGSTDHQDLLEKLVALRPDRNRSILYPGGDHFFSHDKRFQEDFENDVLKFCRDTAAAAAPSQ